MHFGKSTAVIYKCLRGFSMACAVWLCASLPLAAQEAGPQDVATLRVQILNGKTGRPVTGAHLKLFRDAHLTGFAVMAHADKGETTDGEGYAPIPNIDGSVPNVFILVDLHRACSKTDKHDFSLTKVRVAGVVSENSCKPRITMYPQPGTLIFYVRDETFMEKMRH
jgi:hypothetical protein